MTDEEPQPIGRFEWERIVRRIVMPKPHKLLALVMATYADADGSRVRPGNEVLAHVTGDSEKNVRRILAVLKDMGLVSLVERGGGRGGKGKAAEYRLSLPTDLLDRFELLAPGDRPDIQRSGQSVDNPVDSTVDNSESPDTQMSCHSNGSDPIEWTSGARLNGLSGHFQRLSGHPDVRLPILYTTHLDHPSSPVPAEVLTAREETRR